MRRWMAAPLLLAAACLVLDPPPADAQAAKPSEESFNTADGVRLKGLFHKSPNGNKQGEAVVVLLYPPGPEKSMLKGDWDGLIDKLNTEGFHVFRFDWRGHGASTDIVDPLGDGQNAFTGFWVNNVTGSFNKNFVRGFGKKPAKNDLRVKSDILNANQYFPVYINDLAAVRLHLDQKNDNNEVNTGSIYLIGAGDAASLGLMWITAEWKRPAVHPMLPGGLQYKVAPLSNLVPPDPPAGYDIAGAIWLSANRPSPAIPAHLPPAWVRSSLKLRDSNKMLFIYGGTDAAAEKESKAFYHAALIADGDKTKGASKIDQTFLFPIAKTSLNGIALLGKDDTTKTETKTLEYLIARQKDRVNLIRKTRNYVSPYYVDVNYFMNMK